MLTKKRNNKKIKEGVYTIFKSEVVESSTLNQYLGTDGLVSIIDEPIVRQQIIELAKLCESTKSRVSLKANSNKLLLEFW